MLNNLSPLSILSDLAKPIINKAFDITDPTINGQNQAAEVAKITEQERTKQKQLDTEAVKLSAEQETQRKHLETEAAKFREQQETQRKHLETEAAKLSAEQETQRKHLETEAAKFREQQETQRLETEAHAKVVETAIKGYVKSQTTRDKATAEVAVAQINAHKEETLAYYEVKKETVHILGIVAQSSLNNANNGQVLLAILKQAGKILKQPLIVSPEPKISQSLTKATVPPSGLLNSSAQNKTKRLL